VVSLAHAAQILHGQNHEVRFFGVRGNDEAGDLMAEALSRLPFAGTILLLKTGATPRTDVLSDPNYDKGQGERTLINLLGVANQFSPEDLGASFFEAPILAFGATALVPRLHDSLTELLKKAKGKGALTVVNLVYDYRSEAALPGQKWKLGLRDDAYPYIDILIADRDGALKTSGCSGVEAGIAWFLSRGTGAVVVTEGARSIWLAAGKGVFAPLELQAMPVCEEVNRELAEFPQRRGDTTGCGDNFAGGILAGMVEQMAAGPPPRGLLDLREACVLGTVSGGFACFTVGGVFYESQRGEKRRRLEPYLSAYRRQLENFRAE
jgi:sugar/nucleoside kinase (ribokinase family)